MAMLHLDLPPDLQSDVARRAKESGYSSVDAYVTDLLRADTGQPADPAAEEILRTRMDAPSAGAFTPGDFDRLRAQVKDVAARKSAP